MLSEELGDNIAFLEITGSSSHLNLSLLPKGIGGNWEISNNSLPDLELFLTVSVASIKDISQVFGNHFQMSIIWDILYSEAS